MNLFDEIKKKADNGDAESQLKIGLMYEDGNGIEQNYEKAYEYYSKASNQGLDEATNYLGLLYQNGLSKSI